jgi:2-oxoglutarate ferredoxin oxidoreductase subunit beta
MLKLAEAHNGTSFVEIYQNCHIFNDNAFEAFTQRLTRKKATIFVEDGKPLVFGEQQEFGIQLDGHQPKIVELNGDTSVNDLWIHDQSDQIKANILSLFFDNESFPRPFGVLYQRHNEQPKYQSETIFKDVDKANFERLLRGKENWKVE